MLKGFHNTGLNETIAVTCWYIWWIRRHRTHDAKPSDQYIIVRCQFFSIISNNLEGSKAAGYEFRSKVGKKPEPRHIKLNVDGSFHADVSAGYFAVCTLRRFVAVSIEFIYTACGYGCDG
jgi:hypothetical protein